MKPYPKYKDSGVEWIGEVPEGWEVKRTKYFFRLITEKNSTLETKKVALENIESWTGRFIDSEVDYQGEGISFLKGDVLFGKLRPYLAKVLNAKFSGASVGDIFVMRPKLGISSRFAFYRFLSKPFIDIVNGSTFGAKMPRASWNFIANLPIAVPGYDEQTAIATYLEHKTTQIDNLISKKQKRIELLKEERAAIINQAVTRGLNPDAQMKNSGIEWIGEVSEGWTPIRTRFLLQNGYQGIKIGPFGSALKLQDMVQDGIKVYGQENVIANDFQLGDRFISQNKFFEMLVYEIKSGDILITMMGTSGQCQIIPDYAITGIIDSHLIRLRVNEKLILPTYFRLLIDESKYVRHQILMLGKGSIMHGLNSSIIKELLIILPPIKDQKSISTYLDHKTTKIDQTISNIENQIDLLQEYRTTLISEVVTGKIDVRNGGSNG